MNKENGSLTFAVWGCVPRAIKNIILPKNKIVLTKGKDESQRWEKDLTTVSFCAHWEHRPAHSDT